MYDHAPAGYVCPFCLLVQGIENSGTQLRQADIVFQTGEATALMATRKWQNNTGHVLVIPNRHFESIYDLPVPISTEIHSLGRRVALAMKAEYQCDGISIRQNNEPAGDQQIWHYHLHVIPRYENDHFPGTEKDSFPPELHAEYSQKLRSWFGNHKEK